MIIKNNFIDPLRKDFNFSFTFVAKGKDFEYYQDFSNVEGAIAVITYRELFIGIYKEKTNLRVMTMSLESLSFYPLNTVNNINIKDILNVIKQQFLIIDRYYELKAFI